MNNFQTFCRHIIRHKLDLSNSIILCNNCIGGFLYHDFSQKFQSPTINLQIEADGFLRMCSNLEEYMEKTLIEYDSPDNTKLFAEWNTHPFPIGYLGDVKIFFQHYNSFGEAKDAWEKRSKRMIELIKSGAQVNVIMIRKNFGGGEYKKFEELPFTNKIYIYQMTPETFCQTDLKNAYVLRIPDGKQWFDYSLPPFFRYYDQFDFRNWLLKV